jgi:competence protein ComEC
VNAGPSPPPPAVGSVTAPLDLRLGIGAVAAWLAVSLTLGRSPVVTFLIAVGSVLVGLGTWIAARYGGNVTALTVAAFCVALVLLPLSARLARARDGPLAHLALSHANVTADLRVTSDPRPLTASGPASAAPRVAVDADLTAARSGDRAVTVNGHVIVFAPAQTWRDLIPGQLVRSQVRLAPAVNAGLLSATAAAQSAPERIGQAPWWQQAAVLVRSSLRQAASTLPAPARGLLPGLVDGDTSELDPVLAEHFRTAGLMHLLAVSGTNCVIIVGAVLLGLRRLRLGPVLCAAGSGLVLIAFVVVARPSPSVLRAATMSGIALFALAVGRPRLAVPILAAAVLGLLVWRPTLANDAGFTMSVLATGSLLVIAPTWAAGLRRRRVPPIVAESVAVAAAAHLVTAPVIVAISGTVSLVAIPANVLAEPVVAAATIAGFGAALTAPILMPLGQFLAVLAGLPCRWLVWVASWFGTLPGALLPWPSGLVGGLGLLAAIGVVWALAWRPRRRIPLIAMAVTALIVQIPIRSVTSGWPPGGEVFVACDVGQGDALLLPTGPGSAVVVDTGPDPVLIDRCLHDQRVTDVPLVALTHDHVDHVGGIAGVLRGRRVGRVITGPLAEPESGAAFVADALRPRHLQAEPAPVGLGLRVGTVTLEVLGPPQAFRGTRSDPNNSSLVLRAESHGVRILLPGDAEIEAQQRLRVGADVAADVLKVPHHGSAYSDHSFLAAVHARLAVISVGAHNDYGQPAPSLLGELDRLGMVVRRTDRDGDIAVTWTNGRLGTQVRHAVGVAQPGVSRSTTHGQGCGPSADLGAVGSSTVASLADRQAGGLISAVHATMGICRTLPRTSPAGRPLTASSCRISSWSSATRSSSLPEPSSRSPPPRVGLIRVPTSTSGRPARSNQPSCSTCSARRCSEGAGSS